MRKGEVIMQKLYYENPYIFEWDAEVINQIKKIIYILLNYQKQPFIQKVGDNQETLG
ncbi:hypothetical protein PL321_03505 [Caloramator sp. mosi_1]|uniref:hypothetical protein n=1 Tax=Caloramator sp. mosi_1 TaxID=3023090 RepID=UPI00235E8B1F|nr:hypothetical protein [Caloramator sp. mosi_1]WDC84730.1 hypothetical protein PL321_03505 [Caloramator sp. mosi_1]